MSLRSKAEKPVKVIEADLYPPVEKYFAAQGYSVKGEVLGCDLVAVKGDAVRAPPFDSVELMKRYSTVGMAPSQGKLSNINGLAILADARCFLDLLADALQARRDPSTRASPSTPIRLRSSPKAPLAEPSSRR